MTDTNELHDLRVAERVLEGELAWWRSRAESYAAALKEIAENRITYQRGAGQIAREALDV
jgi:hypothetical protein